MPDAKTAVTADIVPFLRYKDARAAIDWLEKAFGLETVAVYGEQDGEIGHAQMRIGNGVIMLSTAKDDGMGMKSPRDLPGVSMGIYVIVPDADAHYERAKAAGAQILMAPVDQDYGGRDYTVRDLEGNVWSFGTYRPEA
ncbi:MAG: VOC family protein [Dehalococcoidia bacterium]